jgi:hypothetical protein
LPLPGELINEVTVYASVGLFAGEVPPIEGLIDATVVRGIYDSFGDLIWPAE